jgi:hypothetical protein
MPFFHFEGDNDFKVQLHTRIQPRCVYLNQFTIIGAATTAGVPDDEVMYLEISEISGMDFNENINNSNARGIPLQITGANTYTTYSPPLSVGKGQGAFQNFRVRILTSSGGLATISRCAFWFSY